MPTEIRDYYQILQVDRSAESEVISAAYRGLARKYHPDTCTLPDATQHMQEINEAYSVLSDPHLRAQYDQVLAQNATQVQRIRPTASSPVAAPPGTGARDSRSRFDFCQIDARQLTPPSMQAFGRRFELFAELQAVDHKQNVMTQSWGEGTYHADMPDQQCKHCQGAYQKLVDELQRDGWRPAGIAGRQWFQQWFKRQREAV